MNVFERRTSTGSGLFALLSRNFDQIFGQIVSIRIKTRSNTNMVAPRLIKREKGSLPVDVRCSKTSLLKLPIAKAISSLEEGGSYKFLGTLENVKQDCPSKRSEGVLAKVIYYLV